MPNPVAPPFYRTVRPGLGLQTVSVVAPATGKYQSNTSVAPTSYTNGVGERIVFVPRSVRVNAGKVNLS